MPPVIAIPNCVDGLVIPTGVSGVWQVLEPARNQYAIDAPATSALAFHEA